MQWKSGDIREVKAKQEIGVKIQLFIKLSVNMKKACNCIFLIEEL